MWLEKQFSQIDHTQNSDTLAMHILSWSQGVTTLGNAFDDYKYVKMEVDKVCDWLDAFS